MVWYVPSYLSSARNECVDVVIQTENNQSMDYLTTMYYCLDHFPQEVLHHDGNPNKDLKIKIISSFIFGK